MLVRGAAAPAAITGWLVFGIYEHYEEHAHEIETQFRQANGVPTNISGWCSGEHVCCIRAIGRLIEHAPKPGKKGSRQSPREEVLIDSDLILEPLDLVICRCGIQTMICVVPLDVFRLATGLLESDCIRSCHRLIMERGLKE